MVTKLQRYMGLALVALVCSASAATKVVFPLHQLSGKPSARSVTCTLPNQPVLVGTNLVSGPPVPANATNGIAIAYLEPTDYDCVIDQGGKAFRIRVPDTTNEVSALGCIVSGVSIPSSNPVFYTREQVDAITAPFVAGTDGTKTGVELADLTINRIFADTFYADGSGPTNTFPVILHYPLVNAARVTGATPYVPSYGTVAWTLGVYADSGSKMTFDNPIPSGYGLNTIATRITLQGTTTNSGCYVWTYSRCVGANANGGQSVSVYTTQGYAVCGTNTTTIWRTNYFANDDNIRAFQIDVCGDAGYGNLTNRIWVLQVQNILLP